jgi:hypothetical protein
MGLFIESWSNETRSCRLSQKRFDPKAISFSARRFWSEKESGVATPVDDLFRLAGAGAASQKRLPKLASI